MQLTTSFVLLALVALRSVGAAPLYRSAEIIDARDLDLTDLQTREYSQAAFLVARDYNDWEDLNARQGPTTPTTPAPAPNGAVKAAVMGPNGKPIPPPLNLGPAPNAPGSPLPTGSAPNTAGTPATPMTPTAGTPTSAMYPAQASASAAYNAPVNNYYGYPGGYPHPSPYGGHHRAQRHRMDQLAKENKESLASLKKVLAENDKLQKAAAAATAKPLTKKQKAELAKKKAEAARAAHKRRQALEKKAKEDRKKAEHKARQDKKKADKKAKDDKKKAEHKAKDDKKKADLDAKKKHEEALKKAKEDAHKKPATPATPTTPTTPTNAPPTPLTPTSPLPNTLLAQPGSPLPTTPGAQPGTPLTPTTPLSPGLSGMYPYSHRYDGYGRHHHYDHSRFAASEAMYAQGRYHRRHPSHVHGYSPY